MFFAALAARRHATIPIYAFEPSRVAYTRLLENLRANGAATVVPFNVAVTNRSGFAAFFEPSGHLTNGSLDRDFAGAFSPDVAQTTVSTIDAAQLEPLVAQNRALLMKIDVEGAEAHVVDSLRPVIERTCPEIVLEVLAPQVRALNDLHFIRDAYDLFLIPDEGLAARPAFEADERNRDFLLLPKTRGAGS